MKTKNAQISQVMVEAMESARSRGLTKDYDVALAIKAALDEHGFRVVRKAAAASIEEAFFAAGYTFEWEERTVWALKNGVKVHYAMQDEGEERERTENFLARRVMHGARTRS